MPREWTDEQRAEARQRALDRGFGKPVADRQAGKVEVHANAPVTRSTAVFIAENEARPMEQTVDQGKGEDGNVVTTTHTRAGTLMMYKPLPYGGYEPRTVSATAIGMLLDEGWAELCPDCGKRHIDKQGHESTSPNLCSARDPVAVRECPVCQKRIYDNVGFQEAAEGEEGDPNLIKEEAYTQSTGATRTKASLDLHLWQKHPRRAQMMKVPPLPAAMSDMLEKA